MTQTTATTVLPSTEVEAIPTPPRRWWERLSPTVVGCTVAAALAMWSTRGAWGARPPAGEDVMAHVVRLDFGISELIAHGRLDGWLPRFYVGYQEFLFQGPGLTWAAAAVRGVTLGGLSNPGAIKVIGVLSLVAVPVAMAFLARSLGLGRVAAGVAAVLVLLVSNPVGVGLQAVYLWGLLPNQLGAALFCLTLGALLRIPMDTRARWVVLGGVSLAALTITHLISLMILAVFFPMLAVGLGRRLFRREPMTRLAITLGLAFALAAWWLVPAVAHRDLQGAIASWTTPTFGDRVDEIVDGRILFRPYTFWLVVAGWLYALKRIRRHRPFALVLVVAPIVYLVLAHAATSWWLNDYTAQLANRGLSYAGLLAILPLAALLAGAARFARRSLRLPSWAGPALVGAMLVLACILVLSPLGPRQNTAREMDDPTPQMREAAAVLHRVVPEGARFAVRRDFGELRQVNDLQPMARLGHVQPPWWLAYTSGRYVLNGFGTESSSTPTPNLEADMFALGTPPPAEEDFFCSVGVTHVVTMSDVLADYRMQSDRYELVWRQSPIAIFAVRPRAGQPDPAAQVTTEAPATAHLRRADPERLRIDVDAARATRTEVAVAWSPKWHGTVDGRSVRLDHASSGLIAVRLPAGSSTLELTYEPDTWDRVGVAISALTVLVLLVIGARWWRRRRLEA